MQEQLLTEHGWFIFPKGILEANSNNEDFDEEEIKLSSPCDGGYALLPFLNEKDETKKPQHPRTFRLSKNWIIYT